MLQSFYTGVSIWRYGAENSASKNFLAPKAVFAAPDNTAAGYCVTVAGYCVTVAGYCVTVAGYCEQSDRCESCASRRRL